MNTAKILWVQDNINGPINGVSFYNNEKLWFVRNDNNTDFNLLRLSADLLLNLEENHKKYCELTGSPLNHGDPIKIKRQEKVTKIPTKQHIKTGENSVEATPRPLGNSISFVHTINPLDIKGELIVTLKESDFVNYNVPNKVEFI
jgi:hypothetical protein